MGYGQPPLHKLPPRHGLATECGGHVATLTAAMEKLAGESWYPKRVADYFAQLGSLSQKENCVVLDELLFRIFWKFCRAVETGVLAGSLQDGPADL